MQKRRIVNIIVASLILFGCGKKSSTPEPPAPELFIIKGSSINGAPASALPYSVKSNPTIRFSFSDVVDRNTVNSNVKFKNNAGTDITYVVTYQNGDSTIAIQPSATLVHLDKYTIDVAASLKSAAGRNLQAAGTTSFITGIDSTRKFPDITDDALLTKVQQQTFKYFWDFGHPISGLARERSNGDNETVTSGGSGFGIMALLVGINRTFITRADGLTRMQTIVAFLKNTAKTVHGAYPHWLNGTTGAIIPFSQKDNGADLVETSYLMQGLLCARQYFNGVTAAEVALRADINTIWNRVEWDWFRQNNQDQLYWHYSENFAWDINLPIRGWNETLITYVLAASSTSHAIPKSVYSTGWTANGANGFLNGTTYYGFQLPLGPAMGGPLFFEHYSFLGINPNSLSDVYAAYSDQTKNHTLINYNYCKANPKGYYGYSDSVWGLTASDVPTGYDASSPTNDRGVIAPTAALSSFPYAPAQSMAALKFYYYVLGDKLFKDYGFIDAFSLSEQWFAKSFLAIDQGPIIVMIENYRTELLWSLFTSCPEVQAGMQNLGFTASYL